MNNYLPILAIESSADLCSAALLLNESKFVDRNILGKYVHSEKLLSTIDNVLYSANIKINDVKLLAISNGPGSFTGLRIGMSVAKGLGFGNNIPIIPVPTYDAIAFQVCREIKQNQRFLIVNSANRDELYIGMFISEERNYSKIEDVHLINKSEFDEDNYDDFVIFGNYPGEKKQNIVSAPKALFVAKWAYIFGKDLVTSNYDYLEPNYLKNFIAKVKK
jgi:tRNA threonylcarbamoyladenosine biosynthesis protein TsaB